MRKAAAISAVALVLSLGSGTAPADPTLRVTRSGIDTTLAWDGPSGKKYYIYRADLHVLTMWSQVGYAKSPWTDVNAAAPGMPDFAYVVTAKPVPPTPQAGERSPGKKKPKK